MNLRAAANVDYRCDCIHVEHAIKEWEKKLKDDNLVISLPRLQSSGLYSNATRCVGIQHRLLPLQLVMNSTAALLIIEVNSATSLRSYDCFTGECKGAYWLQGCCSFISMSIHGSARPYLARSVDTQGRSRFRSVGRPSNSRSRRSVLSNCQTSPWI